MSYYIRLNDETKGPYTIGQLRSMWNSGVLTGDTLYCEEGYKKWGQLRLLAYQLESPPPNVPRVVLPDLPLQRLWSPGAALVLSFFVPGLGQMYRGKIGAGVIWLVLVIIGYYLLILPGLILHVICLVDAYSGDPAKEGSVRSDQKTKRGFRIVLRCAAILAILLMILIVIMKVSVLGARDEDNVRAAREQIVNFNEALRSYNFAFARFPTTAEGIDALIHNEKRSFLDSEMIPTDP